MLRLVFIMLTFATLLTSCNSNSSQQSNKQNLSTSTAQSQNPSETEWKYTYNKFKLLETITEPNGNVTRYDYDNEGHLSKITNPLKQTIQLQNYTEAGNPQTVIDENGVTTQLSYTIDDWLASSTTDSATTKFEYDEVGNLTKVILPDGSYLDYSYDNADRLIAVSNSTGTIEYQLDNAGNRKQVTIRNPDNQITYNEQRVYDEINRLVKLTTATQIQSFIYDNDDTLRYKLNGSNQYTYYWWDGLQRITQLRDANNNSTYYGYDNNTNPITPNVITDAKGNKTNYTYNGLDNLLKLTSPDSGTHNYASYDNNGNLLTQTDANGQQISYTYDKLDRPTSITYASDPSSNTQITYDTGNNAIGKLTKVQNQATSTSYSYDARGNTLSEAHNINNTNYTVNYAYNKANNLTNITYPSTNQIAYGYANGQISKVIINGKTINLSYMPFGPINQISFPNGITENISYNTDYSIKNINLSNDMINRDYSYDRNGQIQAITNVASYNYDAVNSIISADKQRYAYDQVQNRISDTINNTNTSYTIAPDSNRLLASLSNNITTNYQYDNAGNLIKDNLATYSYDGLNRLSKVTVESQTIATYQYNAFSQRTMKDVQGNKTIFIYNSAGQLLEERNITQNTVKDYVYVEGKLLAIIDNGQILYVITDHLNAPQLVLDSNGKTIWSATYAPYGRITIQTGNYELNIRADGQYEDKETRLYYNWHRYYNPDLGRYITSDPLGLQAGMNTYIYVNGNPINYTDPTGLNPFDDAWDYTKPHVDNFVTKYGDYVVGYGDAFYFGASKHLRHYVDYVLTQNGYNQVFASGVNECSNEYKTGYKIGWVQNRITKYQNNKQMLQDILSGKISKDMRAIMGAFYLKYKVNNTELPIEIQKANNSIR